MPTTNIYDKLKANYNIVGPGCAFDNSNMVQSFWIGTLIFIS